MFFKNSRYWQGPVVVAVDSKGRSLQSTSLRLLPDVSGIFSHTVEEGDRFDHLAYRYYKKPRTWWRIVDANPEYLSPLDLMGQGVRETVRIPLHYGGSPAGVPWHRLAEELTGLTGIDDFRFEEKVALVEDEVPAGGVMVPVADEVYERAVIIVYNRMNLNAEALVTAVEATGFTSGEPEPSGRVGKKIIIPPDGSTG